MSKPRISFDWSYRGFRTCILENELLRVTVVPEIGAKVHEMVYKPADRDLLYHHPRVELRRPVFGVNADDWWTGGIDDAIPTGHPCVFGEEELPYLGEVWSLEWSVKQEDDAAVRFTRDGVITPFRIERRMELLSGEPFVRMQHTITNLGSRPFDFIWGIHPGLPLGPATRIQIPARRGHVYDSWPNDRLGLRDSAYDWPLAEMAEQGSEPAGTWDLHFATELEAGWLAVWDAEWRCGFGVTFPHEIFQCVWVWLVDGGWRGIRCVAVEPWIGRPVRLDEAHDAGHSWTLQHGENLVTETRLIGFQTDGPIAGFSADGTPIAAASAEGA